MSANRKTEINIGFISPSKQYEKLSKCLFEIKKNSTTNKYPESKYND